MITGSKKKPGGYALWFNGDGPNIERDSVTCCHCNKVVFIDPLRPIEEFTGWCMACMKFICFQCVERGECAPLERQLEQMEKAHR